MYYLVGNKREAAFVLVGVVLFALFLFAMWRGTHDYGFGKDIAAAERAVAKVTNFSDATISPYQASAIAETCSCPNAAGVIVQGAVAGMSHMGQSEHEGNSPFLFAECEGDARDMLRFLQDEEIFGYAQSMTRTNLGEYPPKQLYFTWDQEKGTCNFYLGCAAMEKCENKAIATGMMTM